jgi:outer membrane lipoprotein SlyB
MTIRKISLATSLGAIALLTACASPQGYRGDYRGDQRVYESQPVNRQVPRYAEYGRVENIGYVQVSQRPSGAGAILGAVIGGVVGNQFGSGTGKALATGAGVVGGAVAGNAIEGRTRRDDEAYRVTVRFDDGSVRDFDFQRVDDLRRGDRVKFEDGQLHRM